jgi:hypothetical protein
MIIPAIGARKIVKNPKAGTMRLPIKERMAVTINASG